MLSIHSVSTLKQCFSVRCLQFSSIIFNIETRHNFCNQPNYQHALLTINKIPKYKQISAEEVESSMPVLLKDVGRDFAVFESELEKSSNYTWNGVILKSEQIVDKLQLAWKAITHLLLVKNNPSLRNAYQKIEPEVVALSNKMSQSKPMFNALEVVIDRFID